MADVSSQTPPNDVTYRPLSTLAVAGFFVSCLFAGIVLVSAAIAIKQGAPFFFDDWILIIAVAGFVLSYSGVSDIRNSEGTKAGTRLASWGMGLSLVCGLGYFAYSYSTRLALTQQANAFLTEIDEDSGFLPRLQKSVQDKTELHRAFLLTLPAFDRAGVRPDDEAGLLRLHDMPGPDGMPGKLSQFRQNELVVALGQAGDKAVITPQGVQNWKYENRSYQVSRLYRIETPEAVTEVSLTVKSSEGEAEGQARTWFVDIRNAYPVSNELTDFGIGIRRLRGQAVAVLQRLGQRLQRPDKAAEPLDFEFAKVDQTDWSKVHVEQSFRDDAKMRVLKVFEQGAATERWQAKLPPDVGGVPYRFDEQRFLTIEVPAQISLGFLGGAGGGNSQLGAQVLFTLRSSAPVDPAAIASAENLHAVPNFHVVGIKFLRVYPFISQ
jgi:hypothetical protein